MTASNSPEIWVKSTKEIQPDTAVLFLTTQYEDVVCREIIDISREYLSMGYNKIIFDLGDIRTTAALGFGQLTSVLKEFRSSGSSMALCNIPDEIKEPLRLIGFLQFFDVFASQDEATENIISK